VLKLPPLSDPAAVLQRLRAEYHKRWKLEWLDPLGFNKTVTMVMRVRRLAPKRSGLFKRMRLAAAGLAAASRLRIFCNAL
jgi:hypothetical protein